MSQRDSSFIVQYFLTFSIHFPKLALFISLKKLFSKSLNACCLSLKHDKILQPLRPVKIVSIYVAKIFLIKIDIWKKFIINVNVACVILPGIPASKNNTLSMSVNNSNLILVIFSAVAKIMRVLSHKFSCINSENRLITKIRH